MTVTARRWLLRLLPRLGVRVLDVGPGVVVLTRDRRVRVTSAGGGGAFVTRRRGLRLRPLGPDDEGPLLLGDREVKVTHLALGGSLVQRGLQVKVKRVADGLVLLHREPTQVKELDPDAFLVSPPNTYRHAKIQRGLHVMGTEELFARECGQRDKMLSKWLLSEHLAEILRRYRVDCVLDVGANRGQYARLLRDIGFRGRIISFEPVPHIFAELSTAAAQDDLWEVHQVAPGREAGELEMNVVPGTLSSLLPPSHFGARRYARLRDVHVQRVPVRRIDEMLRRLVPAGTQPRILLKLDTQGFDLEAFAGLGTVAEQVVALQSEVALLTIYDRMPRLPEALAVYEGAGFEVTGMYPVSREARTARVLEYDCVMVRAPAL